MRGQYGCSVFSRRQWRERLTCKKRVPMPPVYQQVLPSSSHIPLCTQSEDGVWIPLASRLTVPSEKQRPGGDSCSPSPSHPQPTHPPTHDAPRSRATPHLRITPSRLKRKNSSCPMEPCSLTRALVQNLIQTISERLWGGYGSGPVSFRTAIAVGVALLNPL